MLVEWYSMVVRVRIQETSMAGVAALLAHAALIALLPGAWLLGADLGWIRRSGFQDAGVLSHWQLWIVLALSLFWVSWRVRQHPESGSTERF